MGVVLSTNSALAPISFASSVIGIISFVFTLATAIRVFWENFQTFASAPTEIHDFLPNTRQSLLEERSTLRKARKAWRRRRSAGYEILTPQEKRENIGPEAAIQAMQGALKHMITQFRQWEKPFLKDAAERRKQHALGDEAHEYSSGGDDPDYYNCDNRYRKCGVRERILWVKSKNNFVYLSQGLARMETRRIGMQVNEISLHVKQYGRHLDDLDGRLDALDRLEHRMSRVVGVRRVE